MNIVCTICSDLVNQAENIYVTKCGHIFHHHCLVQWLGRSKSCPQCRNKVTEKCMFRLYPTVSNENNGEDAAIIQSRLDNAKLELRQEKAKHKEKEDEIAALSLELKKQEAVVKKYEKQLVSYDSKVKAIRDQLSYANIQCNETQKLREENTALKKNMETLKGLQRVLNATYDEVEEMLKGYSDLRTIATFATALKRALCESESKKKEWRDKLHEMKQQVDLGKKTEADLQLKMRLMEADLMERAATMAFFKKELIAAGVTKYSLVKVPEVKRTPPSDTTTAEVHETPRLNDAILETDSNNSSLNSLVENIEKSDSPYLNLKQGGLHCATALQQGAPRTWTIADRIRRKPAAKNYVLAMMSGIEPHIARSIFSRKEPMEISSSDAKSPSDISYDGMGGHSKPETFPVPKKSPLKSCVPKLSAKHKLKRPNPTDNYNIETMLKKQRDK